MTWVASSKSSKVFSGVVEKLEAGSPADDILRTLKQVVESVADERTGWGSASTANKQGTLRVRAQCLPERVLAAVQATVARQDAERLAREKERGGG